MNRDDEIRVLFAKHGITLMRDDVWIVQGQTVVRHKAVERLAAAIRIVWSEPQIIRSESEEVVILVRGQIGDVVEWSFGEARVQEMRLTGEKHKSGKPVYEPQGIGNYAVTQKQAAYPYAMAEKRGKDRVILKLAGLHGVYSEEEADDFKSPDDAEATKPQQKAQQPHQISSEQSRSKQIYIANAIKRMSEMESASQLLDWAKTERKMVWPQYGIEPHDEDGQRLVKAYKDRMAELEKADETEPME